MELRAVGVRYGRQAPWVLREVDGQLPAGSLVEVTGRNGAGKSSLLRVLAGVLPPATGSVHGRPAVVGWAPERFPSGQPMTVSSYLTLQARVRGLAGAATARAVRREVERWALGDLLATQLPALSKGSAQKVGLAQAVLVGPGLLVLDEPWSGLDADARAAVPGLLREVRDDGGTVVVTDHLRQAGDLLPDVRWHLEGGAVTAGPPRDRPPSARVVVQVEVAAEDGPALLAELRARGLSPVVRE